MEVCTYTERPPIKASEKLTANKNLATEIFRTRHQPEIWAGNDLAFLNKAYTKLDAKETPWKYYNLVIISARW
jgi:hypothetical protein